MKLDAAALSAPVLDHRSMDLASARSVRYVVQQSFRYDYSAPVHGLRQRLVIVPPARHGGQYLRAHRLEVVGAPARRRVRRDRHGNTVAWLYADQVTESIEFRFAALIEQVRECCGRRAAQDTASTAGAAAPVGCLGGSCSGDGLPALPTSALTCRELLRPTRLTAADAGLRSIASDVLRYAEGPRARAERICDVVARSLRYADGVTSVSTTAAEALAGGRGVCQDYAHVMLAVCRAAGLPARYVSGHLLGEGGTHAWVEVIVPGAGQPAAVPLDPCNGRQADVGYVTVAVGRDYLDVAPTSGSYAGMSSNRLTADRRVGVLAAA
jgi:transglutaminase-like putative cysteine protease